MIFKIYGLAINTFIVMVYVGIHNSDMPVWFFTQPVPCVLGGLRIDEDKKGKNGRK